MTALRFLADSVSIVCCALMAYAVIGTIRHLIVCRCCNPRCKEHNP